ncbi:PREDICTED: transmembrane protein 50B-like [Amphimedon queenslandica]|uniref:Transmembrane protein 50A n=1 Tax=Amphimedon queenslandica TaxID=400682 RepID=A0A1X7UC13_AMPQE|nr:PREDICTED: transmembrane protein 50B-like [Amphimedon queenslandica]|eukprot:XP_003388444.1 PREDICTED: transmembrane protein 50B-like [Amphimedon queenslandica]
MSGCIDKISCSCECCDTERLKEWLAPKRNAFASTISGGLFAIGWWLVIDSSVNHSEPIYAAYFMCGIFSTIALLMINSVSTGQIMGDTYTEGCLGRRAARAWLFIGFLFAFGGLIGSLWIFIQQFLVPAVQHGGGHSRRDLDLLDSNNVTASPSPTPSGPEDFNMYIWQGISFFIQNLLIFISTLVYKFGRTEEEDSSW